MATYVGDRIYAYKDPEATLVTLYTNTTDLTTGLNLYDNTGTDTGELVGTVVQTDSFNLATPHVTVDYMTTNDTTGRYAFAVSENYLCAYATNNIYLYSISNSTPTLTNTYTYGVINRYNDYQSTNDKMVFEAFNTSNKTTNKLAFTPATGTLAVEQSVTLSASGTVSSSVGCTNTGIIQQTGSGSLTSLSYTLYLNNSSIASGLSSSSQGLAQTEDDSYLVTQSDGNVYKITSSGITQEAILTNPLAFQYYYSQYNVFYKNGYIYYATSDTSANLIGKRAINDLDTIICSYTAEANMVVRIIGEINGYIYAIYRPSSVSTSSVIKLLVLRSRDLSLVSEQVLPNDPFNLYSGNATFWVNPVIVAQSSKTGYLAVSSYNTSSKRFMVVRIKQELY